MFQRKVTASLVFPKEKTIGWLSWLAGKMRQHSQSLFLVEGLQPSWFGTKAELVAYKSILALSSALILAPFVGLAYWTQGLIFALWSLFLPLIAIVGIAGGSEINITLEATRDWQWNIFWRMTLKGLHLLLTIGLLVATSALPKHWVKCV